MANPTISASLNKAAYVPGEVMNLTVTYADADNTTATVTVTGTDQDGNPATVTLTRSTSDAVTVTVSDSGGKTWAKVTDNGSIAVYTATA